MDKHARSVTSRRKSRVIVGLSLTAISVVVYFMRATYAPASKVTYLGWLGLEWSCVGLFMSARGPIHLKLSAIYARARAGQLRTPPWEKAYALGGFAIFFFWIYEIYKSYF
jgi:hypothetical protein